MQIGNKYKKELNTKKKLILKRNKYEKEIKL